MTPEERDREIFKDRLKARLDEAGLSQAAMEKRIGASSGTFTRVFGGRKALTWEVLRDTSRELGIAPSALVEGTTLAALLPAHEGPPPLPTTEIALEAKLPPPEPVPGDNRGGRAAELSPDDEPDDTYEDLGRRAAELSPDDFEPELEATERIEEPGTRRIPGRVVAAVAAGAAAAGAVLAAILKRRS